MLFSLLFKKQNNILRKWCSYLSKGKEREPAEQDKPNPWTAPFATPCKLLEKGSTVNITFLGLEGENNMKTQRERLNLLSGETESYSGWTCADSGHLNALHTLLETIPSGDPER